MKRLVLLSFTLVLYIFLNPGSLQGQCVIDSMVPNIPGIYPPNIPPYMGCEYGESDVTFLFPRDTMVVIAGQNVTVPFETFTITGIAGLPLGLSWQCNQAPDCIYDVNPNNPSPDTLGCLQVFGTPSVPGMYPIVVYLDVDLGPFLGVTQASYNSSIVVDPCVFTGNCYDYKVSSNCEPAILELTNNIPSGGNPQFSYQWEVKGPGLNYTTSDEQPFPQMLTQAGTYTIDYTLTVDTLGFVLDSVVIDSVICRDAFVNTEPDLYWILKDPQGVDVVNTSANPLNDFNNFPLNIGLPGTLLDTGIYEFQVWDEDNLVPDEGCATGAAGSGASVFFSAPPASAGAFTIINNGLRVLFYVSHPVNITQCADTINIDSLPTQPTIIVMGDTSICNGDSVDLTTMSSDSLQWYLDGLPLLNAQGNSLTVKEGGSYSVVSISRSTRCQNPGIPVNIKVTTVPAPSIGLSLDVFSVSNPDPATLYNWFNNGAQVGTGSTLNAMASGTYWAVATDTATGCMSDTSGMIVYTAVGLDDLADWVSNVSLFPNPSNGIFTLRLDLLQSTEVNILIFDAIGKVVFSETSGVVNGEFVQKLDLRSHSKGMYMLRMELDGTHIHRKLILQ